MRFLVIGLGSMGRRRIRCLQYLGEKDMVGFDVKKDRCDEVYSKYGVKAYTDFEVALSENPDVFIISVPANLHHRYALEAIKRKIHFFTECNFLPEGMDDLVNAEKAGDIVCVPSFTMPHHPLVKTMKSLIEEGRIGNIYSFTYHLACYLPLWHPWEDYRNVYYSKKETPGSTEMVAFELTWIVWLFGDIKEVCGFKAKRSSLEIDFDDTYQVILKFKNGILGHIFVDVTSVPSGRNMKILAEKGTLIWNSEEEMIKFFNSEKGNWKEIKGEAGIIEPGYSVHTHEEMYIEEIDDFLKALRGEKKYPYTFAMERRIISILEAIEQSISERKVVEVKNEV
ncbi:MAG: Gfo/Idh/MocA family oxidoreductase [Candidatus Omnitrophica bacterium]|nr:Gfo/Idh/MocA family oxidoreductase [Candidatus Omnitrophota bacterium]